MMKRIALAVIVFSALGAFAQQQPETSYADDFQSYGTQKNPTGWIDTSVGAPKPTAAAPNRRARR